MSLIILENQIKEDIDYESNFEVRFVLFILGVLLCLIIKLVVQHSFLHTLENTASINKMNYGELIFSFSLCITSKSSTLTNKVMFLIVYCVLSYFIMSMYHLKKCILLLSIRVFPYWYLERYYVFQDEMKI